jgi:hypothetical protein
MDLFHKIMALVDKNSDKIPEGDYLELCDTIHELRQQVKPPSFLLDQNQPLWMGDEAPTYRPTLPVTDGQPRDWMDDELPSDPDTAAQRAREQLHQRWRERDENEDDGDPSAYADNLIGHRRPPSAAEIQNFRMRYGGSITIGEEVLYPGLNQFLQELHEEWSATDNIGPVEPGAYYPPPRQGMHQHIEDGTTVAEVSMMDVD